MQRAAPTTRAETAASPCRGSASAPSVPPADAVTRLVSGRVCAPPAMPAPAVKARTGAPGPPSLQHSCLPAASCPPAPSPGPPACCRHGCRGGRRRRAGQLPGSQAAEAAARACPARAGSCCPACVWDPSGTHGRRAELQSCGSHPRGPSQLAAPVAPPRPFPGSPLQLGLQGELRELGQALSRDIVVESPDVAWDDIAGLGEAKRCAPACGAHGGTGGRRGLPAMPDRCHTPTHTLKRARACRAGCCRRLW